MLTADRDLEYSQWHIEAEAAVIGDSGCDPGGASLVQLNAEASRPRARQPVPGPGAGPAFRSWPAKASWEVDPDGSSVLAQGANGGVAIPADTAARGTNSDLPIPAECMVDHSASMPVPLPRLALEKPGTNLWCYFGWLERWVRVGSVAGMQKDYGLFAAEIDYSSALPTSGPYFNVSYDGGWYLSRNNIFSYDDLYCHANRWLRGQGLPHVAANFTAWYEVQRAECAGLAGRFPENDLSIEDMLQRTRQELNMLTASVGGHGPAPTVLDMQRHAAVKCAMGPPSGLGCDMAYCQNWCLLPDHRIGRNKAECGEYWNVRSLY